MPDAGNTEFFINLQPNPHLDAAYGGFAVFAAVADGDAASFAVMDAIAGVLIAKKGTTVQVVSLELFAY